MTKTLCRDCVIFKIIEVTKLYIMNILSKKCVFLLNIIVGCIIFIIVNSRFQNPDRTILKIRKIVRSEIEVSPTILKSILNTEKIKVPWRFQIEEDGFYFPVQYEKEKYITYDPVNSSWSDQILQFENACVFAALLKRTLLVPALLPYRSTLHNGKHLTAATAAQTQRVPLFHILDSDVLSKKIKIRPFDKIYANRIKTMSKYNVCLDSRLGFWIDYIPSVENIQTWRLLRQQEFQRIDINSIKNDVKCPETIIGRWTYPKSTKVMYRGILTELQKKEEDVLYFHRDTLSSTYLRLFDKQRVADLQELLLLYVTYTPAIKSRLKILVNILGPAYTAVNFDFKTNVNKTVEDTLLDVQRELVRVDALKMTKNVVVITDSNRKVISDRFKKFGYSVIFARDFITDNIQLIDDSIQDDKIHLIALLLCAYAYHFIPTNSTSADVYFIRHLRTNDLLMANGLATEYINVRWAKHTTKEKVVEFQKKKFEKEMKMFESSSMVTNTTARIAHVLTSNQTRGNSSNEVIGNLTKEIQKLNKPSIVIKLTSSLNLKAKNMNYDKNKTQKPAVHVVGRQTILKIEKRESSTIKSRRTKDQLTSMVCLFCNYIRHITGHPGCPSMKDVC